MTDYFSAKLNENDIKQISNLGLAHIGDAVYELLVRTRLCLHGGVSNKKMHQATVARVSAVAQAKAVEKILPHLTETELEVYRRGRNAKVNSVPNRATLEQYHAATGLEALFGFIYLSGDHERINTLFALIMDGEGTDAT